MPGTNEATADDREFRRGLTDNEYDVFRRLEAAWQSKGDRDLAWYHAFGRWVEELRGGGGGRTHRRMGQLAEALAYSRSLLTKARDFAQQFDAEEATGLAKEGIGWGMVYPTFPIRNKG